jgi:serine/threonine-protein kinase HipA
LQNQHRVKALKEPFDQQTFVIEWLRRDLLNQVFGNSDNHGRNTALIKRPQGIWLAPIYDFAPMKADPESIIRTMQWGSPFEEGGRMDWLAITEQLADLVEPSLAFAALKETTEKLPGLKEQ